jgi:condensin complex subunit 1
MKFLVPLASDKERQVEALLEKLCQKFDGTRGTLSFLIFFFDHSLDLKYSKEVMFCISLLPFSSEKSIAKFVLYFKSYKELLYDNEVCSMVGQIVEKVLTHFHFFVLIFWS